MSKISINEVAAVLMERNGLGRKAVTTFVNEMFNIVQEGLEQDRLVKIKGLGTFKIIDVEDRESVNVNTGERVLIEGHSKISFTPDSFMKELVNKPFSQFETVVLNEGVDFADVPDEQPGTEEPIIEEPAIEEPATDGFINEDEPEQYVDMEASSAPLVDFVTSENMPEETEKDMPASEQSAVDVVEKSIIKEETPVIKEEVPVIKEEAVIKEEVPIIEEETPIAEEETPVVEDEESAIEEETAVEEETTAVEEESSGLSWKKWILPLLLLCGVFFAGGYYVGRYAVQGEVEPKQKAEPEVKVAPPQKSQPQTKPQPESKAQPEIKPEIKPEVKPDFQPEQPKAVEPEQPKVEAEQPVALDKYEQMDVRIRTGAYRIVGTDHVEKVKETDNLAKICKRTIGPDMECYLMAYNGIKSDADLKPGMSIKIPKLELKKKKNQNKQANN